MWLKAVCLTACLCCVSSAPALASPSRQTQGAAGVAPAVAERTHVERFSSPEARAGRAEAEAAAKLAANPDDVAALHARAQARLHLGNYAGAHEDLRRAATLKPANADYRASLGYALWKLGRRPEAVEAVRAALKLDEKNFAANYHLGRFVLLLAGGADKGLLPEAVKHLQRALELDPRRNEIRLDLLTAYRALGDVPQATKQLKLLEDARPSDARVTYAAALLASDRGDVEAALRGFNEALRLDPELVGARQDLGLAYVKTKRWDEAARSFSDLARRKADSIEAAYFHALALYNTGRLREAEAEARRALRLEPSAAAAHTLLGIVLATRGGADAEAAESLAQAVALTPESFDAHLYLGRVQYAAKDFAGAAKSLRRAAALDPAHAEARFFLGTALEAAGDADAALAEYAELVKLDAQSAFGQIGLGALQVKRGEIEAAVETLKRATSLAPQSFEAHWSLGRALALAGRHAEAVAPFKQAAELIPDRADARYQFGLALRRIGRAEEAARELAAAEQINREFRARTK